uniref:Uncharacterized protein n=1 Tax=Rhizophora mucronata TaxID=61149 RepID=A0A2P2R1D5_RHIMU
MDCLLINMRKLNYIRPKLLGNLLEQVALMNEKGCPANA